MKKRKLVKGLGVGAALSGLLFGAGCHPQCVYGPPPTDEPEETDPGETDTEPASFEPTENIPEPVYGPPEWFDSSENENVVVYGPPEWFTEDETEESGEESTEEEKETRTIEPETLDPGTNINDPLYGVPTPTVSR